MVRAKRRDEWDRTGILLALIHNRTDFSDKPEPKYAIDFWPDGLLTEEEKQRARPVARGYKKVSLSTIVDRIIPRGRAG